MKSMQNIMIIIGVSFITTAVFFTATTNFLNTFTESYAQLASITTTTNQSQQQQLEQLANTIRINLSDSLYGGELIGESVSYREIGNIQTNVSELEEMEVEGGIFSQVSARDDALSITFPAKIPNPQNPNMKDILDIDITLDVDSVETKSNGLKIYYASFGFAPGYISNYEVIEGVLEQMSQDEAVLTLLLKQQQ